MSSKKGIRNLGAARWRYSRERLEFEFVSPRSRWSDRVWRWSSNSPGSGGTSINWSLGVTEEEWESSEWQTLVDLGRRFVDAHRFSGIRRKTEDASVFRIGTFLLRLLRWMYEQRLRGFSDLNPEMARAFVEEVAGSDLLAEAERCHEDTISQATLARYVDILVAIYEQRSELAPIPYAEMTRHPFDGRSSYKVACELIEYVERHLPAMPTEVFNAIIPAAQEWVRTFAGDILALQGDFLRSREDASHYKGNSYMYHTDRALMAFRFDLSGTRRTPWRPPIMGAREARDAAAEHGSGKSAGPSAQFRKLVLQLRSCATMLIQAMCGMRISEVLGLSAEPRQDNGWPACIVVRSSPSGLYEMFFIKGMILKTDDGKPAEAEWLAGARPVGARWLPDAVEAVLVLDKLFAPWREMWRSGLLMVSLGKGMGPLRSKKVGEDGAQGSISSDTVREWHRGFVAEHVKLPASHSDWLVSTHQFRSRWAQDIVEVDPNLLVAVQEQLHHRHLATSETSYIGNDPSLNRLLDDRSTRHTAMVMHEFVFGTHTVFGRMAEVLRENASSIRSFCERHCTKEQQISALQQLLDADGIRIWPGLSGDCLFHSDRARCHHREFGEFISTATRPLVTHRTTDLCFSCANYMIFARHRPYWENRLSENRTISEQNRRDGNVALRVLADLRASQAAQVLEWIGHHDKG